MNCALFRPLRSKSDLVRVRTAGAQQAEAPCEEVDAWLVALLLAVLIGPLLAVLRQAAARQLRRRQRLL
jgi:hypothetical protein